MGWVGRRPVIVGMVCSVWKAWGMLLDKMVCGGVERIESGVSGVGGEYADWETAGTWWAVVTPPETERVKEENQAVKWLILSWVYYSCWPDTSAHLHCFSLFCHFLQTCCVEVGEAAPTLPEASEPPSAGTPFPETEPSARCHLSAAVKEIHTKWF